jgi:hypothetical protein
MSILAFTAGAAGAFATGLTLGSIVLAPRVGPWRATAPAPAEQQCRPVLVVQEARQPAQLDPRMFALSVLNSGQPLTADARGALARVLLETAPRRAVEGGGPR